MTKLEIKTEVLNRCNLTSSDAGARVDAAIDRHYKRITSLLGLETTRVESRFTTMTLGSQTIVIAGMEKADRVFDTSDPTSKRLIPEVSLHRMQVTQAGSGPPTAWAMSQAAADALTITLDTIPQTDPGPSIQVDGWVSRATLADSDEPIFPASFHDVLTWFVLSEELLRKEKHQLAAAYETKANTLLADLRFQLADTHTRELRQNSHPGGGMGTGPGGGGGVPHGGSSYTQTGDLTFDRPGVGVPPFFVAPDNTGIVSNLNADMVDGEHAAQLHDLSLATGTLPFDSLPAIPPNTVLGRDAAAVGDGPAQPLQVWTGLATEAGRLLIPNNGIVTPLINAGAVTTPKIGDAQVTTPKIADLNVTNAKVADDNLVAGKLHATASPIVFVRKTAGAGPGEEAGFTSTIGFSAGGNLKVVPAGVNGELQYNDLSSGAAVLAAAPGFTWDKTNGALNLPTNPRCMLYQTSHTPVAATWGTVLFPNEDFDIGNLHSTISNTSRITIPAGFGGLWLVGGATAWTNASAGPIRLRIIKNGAATSFMTIGGGTQATAGQTSTGQVNGITQLVAGDYIELQLWSPNTNVHGGATREEYLQFFATRLLG